MAKINWATRRGREGTWDRGIINEVANSYYWDKIDWNKVTVAVDIGAHIGSWSRMVQERMSSGVIAAVEPVAANYSLLCQNLLSLERITSYIFNTACYYGAAEGYMHIVLDNTGGHPFSTAEGDQRVDTMTLEDILAIVGYDYISVLKLDCEGSEENILLHAPDSTLQHVHHIVGEYHNKKRFLEHVVPHLERFFDVQVDPTVYPLGMFYAVNKSLGG